MSVPAPVELRAPGGPALVVAHRGAWDPAPQNSLDAFEAAITAGADAVELDVRRTADDRLVVVHDPRLRLRPLGRLTTAQARERLAPGQAPELEEVLTTLTGRILVDVELKEDGYVADAMAMVTRCLPAGGYVVTSFRDAVLPQVRAAAPGARIGLLVASRQPLRRLERRVGQTGADFLAPHLGLIPTGILRWAAEHDLPAWVWTVNEPADQHALLFDPQVEAIITDHVARAVVEAGEGPQPV